MIRSIITAMLMLLAAATAAEAKCDPIMTNDGRYLCQDGGREVSRQERPQSRSGARTEVIRFLPNPPGCRRIARSCACRLAAYWSLGKGLDRVRTWPKTFRRTHSPGPGVAAIELRPGGPDHIMGIVGGGPGAWLVADFNSGGHKNRLRRVSSLRGYILVDTRARTASSRR